jgi:hypothetical protein
MSLIKEIKAQLKAKYPGVNLSNKRIDAIAAKVDAKVTEVGQIDDVLDTFNDFYAFADMARDDDRERLRLKKETESDPVDPANPTPPIPPAPAPDPAETPTEKLLKQALAGIAALTGEVASIKGEKVTNTRKEQLAKILENTPDAFKNKAIKDFNRMKFDTDEEFNDYLAETETDAADFIQEQSNAGLGGDRPAAAFGQQVGKVKVATDAELDAVMENL